MTVKTEIAIKTLKVTTIALKLDPFGDIGTERKTIVNSFSLL